VQDEKESDMKIFVTGATGFVGNAIVRQLLAAGHTPRCLVRRGSEGKLTQPGVEFHPGDALDPATLAGALDGCAAVMHLVGIIREIPQRQVTFQRLHVEATANVLAAAQAQGVRRYLHMSANGARAAAPTPYQRSKWQAEELVRASGLDWTIFRPSLIYGRGDGFITLLARMVRRLPVLPVLGDGRYLLSPVAVGDVAAGFVAALTRPATIGQSFACGGPDTISYDRLLDLVGAALDRPAPLKLHQPLLLMRPLIAAGQHLPGFPITADQLTMLLQGNSCDPAPWARDCGLALTPLAEGLGRMLATVAD
jgi:NADH dehydrogenase